MAVDPGDDTDPEDPQSWNKYAYVRNNPLRYIDPSGEALVNKEAQEDHNRIVSDPNRTPAEKNAAAGAAASPIKVEKNTSPDASIKVGANGAPATQEGLAPGELIVTGDPGSPTAPAAGTVRAVAEGMQSKKQQVSVEYGTTEPGPVVGGQMQSASITVFAGNFTAFSDAPAVAKKTPTDVTIHEFGHIGTTGLKPEGQVRKELKGTPAGGN